MRTLVSASISNSMAVTHLLLAVDALEYAQAVADSFKQVSEAVSVRWTNSAQECLDTLRVHKEEGGVPPPGPPDPWPGEIRPLKLGYPEGYP
ncbi:MAG: hypothetical protein ACM31P_10940 [Actinomycetota bacterium]